MKRRKFLGRNRIVVGVSMLGLFLAGACGGETGSGDGSASEDRGFAELEFNQELHDMLPETIRESGVIRNGTPVGFPPYISQSAPGEPVEGLVPDMATAMSELLGVEFEYIITDFQSIFPSMASGRFEISWGMLSDTKERQQTSGADFVDFRESIQTLLSKASDPVDGLAEACGRTVGTLAGNLITERMEEQSALCVEQGDEPITIRDYPDQPAARTQLLAGQIDAFMGDYSENYLFAESVKDQEELFLSENGEVAGLTAIAVTKKLPELSEALLAALRELKEAGVYDEILDKWDASGSLDIDQMVINGAK